MNDVIERRRAIRSAASPKVRLYALEGLTALFPEPESGSPLFHMKQGTF